MKSVAWSSALALLLPFAFFIAPAHAKQWVELGSSAVSFVAMDRDSIAATNNIRDAEILVYFATAKPDASGRLTNRTFFRYQFNCATLEARRLKGMKVDTKGKLAETLPAKPAWKAATGTIQGVYLGAACFPDEFFAGRAHFSDQGKLIADYRRRHPQVK